MKRHVISVAVVLALATAPLALSPRTPRWCGRAPFSRARRWSTATMTCPGRCARQFASDLSRVDLRQRGATVDTDIPRLREGQVSGQFWSVFIPSGLPNPARTQLEQIELARRMIDAYPDTFLFATRAADVERARQQGKIASFLGMENGQAIENSLGALRAYFALGVRYMTLTHGKNNDWADSATDTPAHGGLTPFGREVVREMNRLGMLVDISHVSPDVMRQVLDVSEAPVIFSHSSARALVDHPRNVPDDVLARMAKNGGVVNVTFIPPFVSAATAAWGKGLEPSIFERQDGRRDGEAAEGLRRRPRPGPGRDAGPGRGPHRPRRPHRRPRSRRHRQRLLRQHGRAHGTRGREPLPRPLRRADPPRLERRRPREARRGQSAPRARGSGDGGNPPRRAAAALDRDDRSAGRQEDAVTVHGRPGCASRGRTMSVGISRRSRVITKPRFVAQQLYERFRRIHTLLQLETVDSGQTRFVDHLVRPESPRTNSPGT